MQIGLFFYFKRIAVEGTQHIPKKGAVIFVSNHQNALLDPLLIGVSNKRNTHFLTRASAFKNKVAAGVLKVFQLVPIYRFRDGFSSLKGNDSTFKQCIALLKKEKAILIFAEGNHNMARRVRPLTKGFTKIIFDALAKYPDLHITLVPVGLNYQKVSHYPTRASVVFGKSFNATDFFSNRTFHEASALLLEETRQQLKLLTTHIPEEQYEATASKLEALAVDFTKPTPINHWISNNQLPLPIYHAPKGFLKNSVRALFILNTFFPFVIWKRIVLPKVDEEEFVGTFRFAVGMTLVPLFLLIQTIAIAYFFGISYGYLYILFSVVLLWFVKRFT